MDTGDFAIFCAVGLPMLVGGFVVYLNHRKEMFKIMSASNSQNSKQTEAMLARIATLETKCAKLEEQVLLAHEQLADERRQLDNKLSAILPEISSDSKAPRPAERSKTIG